MAVSRGKEMKLTLLKHILQLLSDSKDLHASPEISPVGLGNAESPATAENVAAILPDGLEPGLEQVDGLAHLDVLDGHVVVVAPEILDALDRGPELLQVRVVATIGGLALLVLIRSVYICDVLEAAVHCTCIQTFIHTYRTKRSSNAASAKDASS